MNTEKLLKINKLILSVVATLGAMFSGFAILSSASPSSPSQDTNCSISITSPTPSEIEPVKNNTEDKKKSDRYMFTLSGTVSGMGDEDVVCIYMKKDGGTNYWRSSGAIPKIDIDKDDKWSTDDVSCGSSDDPNPTCLATATVRKEKDCEVSGANKIKKIEPLCEDVAKYHTTAYFNK